MLPLQQSMNAATLAFLVLAAMWLPMAQAAGPDLIHYQGYLTENNGDPVTSPVPLGFGVYSTPSGGSPLWIEDHGNVTPDNGVFSVVLGSLVAFPNGLFANSTLWLETVVDGNPMVPRRQFLSVPYAFRAAVADSAVTGGGGGDDGDWETSGNNIYRLAGNVAIGSINATSHLTVSRDLQAQDHQLELRNTGSIQQPNFDGIAFTQGVNGQTTLGSIQLDYRNDGNPDMGFNLRGLNNVLYLMGASMGDPPPFGRVGIGTTTPTSKLEVVSDTNPVVQARQSAVSGADAGIAVRGSRNVAGTGDAAYLDLRNFDSDVSVDFPMARVGAGLQDDSGQTGFLRFSTNNGGGLEERMRIDKAGNVGVGLPPSGSRLFVVQVDNTGAAGRFVVNDSNNTWPAVSAANLGIGQAGFFQILNPASSTPVIETQRITPGLHARFNGDVQVTGNLTKGGGTFKIDHPLDPEHKYLSHSFVESPDMMNIYNGNVICDPNGEAVVELPDWFNALNKDYRYQLTAIGEAAVVYVASEVAQGQFRIAGGRPGLKVSWQVTGIRQDAYAQANRVQVEEEKPAELHGYYLHPESFGLGAERGIPAGEAAAAREAPESAAESAVAAR